MKYTDLIEAIQTAAELYKRKHNKPMEIFDFNFEDDRSAGIRIEACSKVIYEHGEFMGSKTGKKPLAKIIITFEFFGGKLDDRAVQFEDEDDE